MTRDGMDSTSPQVLDSTPHPRVLSVFKDIEFTMLQCFCELIDNSIDGFLDAKARGEDVADPSVSIATGMDTVKVIDNGPGMTLDRLEKSVKAGWTSKNGTESLGLYGMGFNIATARLGSVTRIWTTTKGDKEWHGVQLDLKHMATTGSFLLEVLHRPKTLPDDTGTEIEITDLKPEWESKLNGAWFKNNITDRLSRIYKSMLRDENPAPIFFNLRINGRKVPAWKHCYWPDSKTVETRSHEIIRPVEYINQVFGKKYRVISTGEIIAEPDGHDPADLIEFEERVHGWIGIQRYLDENDFGIDVIRNGRVIEMANKDIFDWVDESGERRKEYPLDDLRGKGRIIGEIHLDHGYVFYTKNKFEHEHSSWIQLLKAVRNNMPITSRRGQAPVQNDSPLARLNRAFRRSSPQRPQTYSDILVIAANEKAKKAAEGYRKGQAPYTSEKWWDEALKESDKSEETPAPPGSKEFDLFKPPVAGVSNTTLDEQPTTSPSPTTTDLPTTPGLKVDTVPGAGPGSVVPVPVPPSTPAAPPRTHLANLDMKITGQVSEQPYEARVYTIETQDPDFVLSGKATTKGIYEIEVNPTHPTFQSASFQVRDGVMAEFAQYVAREEASRLGFSGGRVEFSTILAAIREEHGTHNSLEPNRVALDIQNLTGRLQGFLGKAIPPEKYDAILAALPPENLNRLKVAQVKSKGKSVPALLDIRDMTHVLDVMPGELLSSGLFKAAWEPDGLLSSPEVLRTYQTDLTHQVKSLFYAIAGFDQTDEDSLAKNNLMFVRAALTRLADLLGQE